MNNTRAFSEILFVLLSGTGAGYSVQKRHIQGLPIIQQPKEEGTFIVHDSIEGWSQALEVLLDSYFFRRIKPQFDFSNIRPKGSYLVTTGAKAPGAEPLRQMLKQVEDKIKIAVGRKLQSIEVHDIICIVADCVLSGGIRRAALACLFDADDEEMLKAKHGEWWVKYPYRARANNSAVLNRDTTTKELFEYVFDMCIKSNAGEPGFFWTNDYDLGTNPCVVGDTKILTKNGYVRIDSVVNKEVDVWNGFEYSKVTPKITGRNQEILTIKFSDGNVLTCTKYHKFHIANGYKGTSSIIEAKDLSVGMKLIKHEFPIIEHGKNLKNAYTQGFVSAEGMDSYDFVWVYQPKAICLDRLSENSSKVTGNNKRFAVHFKDPMLPKSFVPHEYNLKSKLEWLSGLFDGDGTELKEGGLQLVSTDRNFLMEVKFLLNTMGVQSKVLNGLPAGKRKMPDGRGGHKYFECKETYRACIGAVQMQHLKRLGLKCERMKFDKTPQRDASQFISITSIEHSGIADTVYCFNEPKNHTGIFNGVITGQCFEISLNSNQFCNLTTINQTGIKDKKDFLNRVYAASLIGTLQAAYTDFPYLTPTWKEVTEREALLGVSFTGIADANNVVTSEMLQEASKLVVEVNQKYAKKIGINCAARTTTVKPEGTVSCVLGSSSGIHARHSKWYLRRVRMNKDDALAVYLKQVIPHLVEDDVTNNTGVVITIPQASPEGAVLRESESALDVLDRTLNYHKNWVLPGHIQGKNTHNVSVTINYKTEEIDGLRKRLWKDRHNYTGISLIPFDGGNYKQAPFEVCGEDVYKTYMDMVAEIDLKQVRESDDNTNRIDQLACVGGVCELNF